MTQVKVDLQLKSAELVQQKENNTELVKKDQLAEKSAKMLLSKVQVWTTYRYLDQFEFWVVIGPGDTSLGLRSASSKPRLGIPTPWFWSPSLGLSEPGIPKPNLQLL